MRKQPGVSHCIRDWASWFPNLNASTISVSEILGILATIDTARVSQALSACVAAFELIEHFCQCGRPATYDTCRQCGLRIGGQSYVLDPANRPLDQ